MWPSRSTLPGDGVLLAEQSHTTGPDDPGQTTVWDWEPHSFRPLSQTERVSPRDAPQEWVDEQFYAIVTDLVGTPTEMVDSDGNLAWHPHTTLWGTVALSSGGASCPLRFPGQYYDPETGLNYNYHRYYDSLGGRYGSNDPLGLGAGLNPQAYVPNPAYWIDPLGLMGCGGGQQFYRGQNLVRPRLSRHGPMNTVSIFCPGLSRVRTESQSSTIRAAFLLADSSLARLTRNPCRANYGLSNVARIWNVMKPFPLRAHP